MHAQAMHRCSLKPDRPTMSRHTAVSQAMPARPLAPRCCLTRLTHLPRCRLLSGCRTPSGGTSGCSGTPAGLGLSPGLYAPGSAPAAGGMRTPATAVTWGCRHRDLVHPSLEFSNLHPDCRRAALQLRLCRGIQRRRLTRGVVIEPVYDAVLQAGAFLSVLPTKILYFPSCLRVANDGVSFIRYFVNWACTLYDHRHRMSSFIWG